MWGRRLGLLIALAGALTAGGCMRSTQSYLVYDPNTGQHYTTTALPQAYAQPSYAPSPSAQPSYGQQQAQGFELYGKGGSGGTAPRRYSQGAAPAYAPGPVQSYAQAAPQAAAPSSSAQPIENRGLFTSHSRSAPRYVTAPQPAAVQPSYVVQYSPPVAQGTYGQASYGSYGSQVSYEPQGSYGSYGRPIPQATQGSTTAPRGYQAGTVTAYPQTSVPVQATAAAPRYAYATPAPAASGAYGAYAAATPTSSRYGASSYGYGAARYASAPAASPSYTLDAGDRLRVVVFGQDGLSNTYTVDAGGNINMPLIGTLAVRGVTTQQVAQLITARLKQGYVREPHVSVEIETYRPFFILGEVNTPGQYPYVPNMTAEAAIATAGGFAPRASKSKVELTRNVPGQQIHGLVPLNYPLKPGDTIVVKERWF
ncbi:MAG: Capsule polysaccharide export protein [Pseudolabrys sp.]|jgi:polysaccharide export outer membrane protein|nr:Capsule polysaccharide export protein [Pseudolabrys sp.]